MAAGLFKQMFGKSIYVGSAGVQRGFLDPFAVAVMEEIGIDIARHKPVTFEDVEDLEGAYRAVRDELTARIRERFGRAGGGNE